jgi:Mannosyltransferase (PIG-V)
VNARADSIPASSRPEPTERSWYAIGTFLWTRAAIAAVAMLATTLPTHARLEREGASPLLHDLGRPIDIWARWDSVWYLMIAEHGYHAAAETLAFWPLYPALIAVLGAALGGHDLAAGVLVSLVSLLGAMILLERLGTTLLDRSAARRAVLYLALFPTAFFLGAVYSESLYLLLAIGAFLLAERGRFLPAGVVCGLAILTRVAGVTLLPALALIAWRSGDRRRAVLSLAAAPLIASVHLLVVADARGGLGDLLGAQAFWKRHLSPAGPLGGIGHGFAKAWSTALELGDSGGPNLLWPSELLNAAFLVLFVVLTVIAWRRVGAPYGLFAALSLSLPLSFPATPSPLLSLPRFGLVVFPFFLALAVVGKPARVNVAIIGISGAALALATVEWVRWGWIG